MMVVLVAAGGEAVLLAPSAVAALGQLGVTSISVAGDGQTLGIVLDGWAFDPARAGDEALSVVAGSAAAQARARALRPMMTVAVSPDTTAGAVLHGKGECDEHM